VVFTIRNSDGTELTVTHEPTQVRTAFDVESGSTITVAGTGYQPGTGITVWLYSTPRRLGTSTTDDRGQFSAELTIPTGIDIGSHTLSIDGTTARGTSTTRIGININRPVSDVPVTGSAPSNTVSFAVILVALGILALLRARRLD